LSIQFKISNTSELNTFILEYVNSLSSPIDSFLEDHILDSVFYKIMINNRIEGYFAVHHKKLLTQFYLNFPHYKVSQDIFRKVIKDHSIESIFVPTCDELFLSLVLDLEYSISNQAYFFSDTKEDILTEKLYMEGEFNLATISDIEKIVDISQDFLNNLEDRITKGEIFTFYKDNSLLGVGIVEKSKLLTGYASIGMFTNENYRQLGIGRTIIYHLKKWCYGNQLIPICGCWYYNTLSKQTIESANMVTKTRLLNAKVR